MLILIFFLAASPSYGQIIYGQPGFGNPQLFYTHWTIKNDLLGETKINQTVIPVTGYIPLKDNLEMQIFMASTSNSMEFAPFDLKFSGLSDLKLQINHSLSDDRYLISGGINLPTGKKELELNTEWAILEALSYDFLDFPMRRLGEGFGFNILAGAATSINEFRVGGGIMYEYNGTYTPYAGADDYNPGDIISINAGADLTKGFMSWSLNMAYTTYTADLTDDRKSFKQSPSFNITLGGVYIKDNITFGNHINYLLRGENTFYDTTETILTELQLFGDELAFDSYLSWFSDGGLYFSPSLGYRKISENEFSFGSAKIFSFGGLVGKKLNERYDINAGIKFFTGDADGGVLDISGYQLNTGLTATF